MGFESITETTVLGGDVLDDGLTAGTVPLLEAPDGSGHHLVVRGVCRGFPGGLGLVGFVALGGHLDLCLVLFFFFDLADLESCSSLDECRPELEAFDL